jgi:hypothetical protein
MTREKEVPPLPMTAREFALRHQFNVIRDTVLPAPLQAAILRQCPGVAIQALEDAIDAYRFAEVLAPPIPLNERKASLEKVARLATELASAIENLGTFERSALHGHLSQGRKAGLARPRRLLSTIAKSALSEAARIEPSPGRPLTRKANVVRDVACELKRCGLVPDASSKGPLVFIVTELFSLISESPPDVRSLVRNALAKMDGETFDFRQGIAA